MAALSTTLDNIVNHWKLDEESGNRADSAGSITLTANGTGGVGYTAGKQGNAADFNSGETDYLSNAAYAVASSSADFSFSFWVYWDTLPPSGYQQILQKWGTVGNRCWNGPYIQYQSAGNYYFYMDYRDAANNITSGYKILALSTGQWYHFVVTADVSAKTFVFYRNGSDVGAPTYDAQNATTVATGSSLITVGSDASSGVIGQLDEFTITSDIITSSEVTTIYNSGNGIPYTEAAAAPSENRRRRGRHVWW